MDGSVLKQCNSTALELVSFALRCWYTIDVKYTGLYVLHKESWLLVIRWASAKLENSFVTANCASAPAQLSKLEGQRALPPNYGQIMKKQLFIFPNYLTILQTSTLHNTFYFNNTWTKIQLRSDPVNMQPDKTKCYPQRPITTLWPAACKMLSTFSGSPPLRTVGHYHYTHREELQHSEGAAGYWNVTLATTRWQACIDILRPIFNVGKARCDGSLKFVFMV